MPALKSYSHNMTRSSTVSEWYIPLSDLSYGADEEEAVLRVLRSRWLSMGPEVQAFEQEFASLLNVKHALAVANGTAAIHLAYAAAGLGPGDEIIQPAINFVAAANMTMAIGATPVFADIVGLGEPTIDPAEIERLITPRSKAVVVMHYGGYVCRMAGINALCRERGLLVIEDACHAVGASYEDQQGQPPHGRMAGALGDIGCFSFFSNKNMATGEGGMVVTDRDDIAKRLRLLRSHGMTTLTWDRHRGHASSYDVVANGYNYRIDELRAALGRCQLARLTGNNTRRGELVRAYRHALEGLPGWTVPFADYAGSSAYHLMIVVAPNHETRELAARTLKEAGIQTSLHYPHIPNFSAFAGLQAGALKISPEFAQRVLTLPLFPGLAESQVAEICSLIRQVAVA